MSCGSFYYHDSRLRYMKHNEIWMKNYGEETWKLPKDSTSRN